MPFRFEKLSVLVVEDSAPMLEVMLDCLRYLGVKNLFFARNGEEGYQQYLRNKPDIIITDWEMEPVSGLEMIDWVRRNRGSPKPIIPIIVMTGYAAAERVHHARDLGATEFLVKPFTANELARRIAYVIDQPRDFVETQQFFGPDRRRRKNLDYQGPDRRKEED